MAYWSTADTSLLLWKYWGWWHHGGMFMTKYGSLWYLIELRKGFLSNLDTYESILYSSRASNNGDDYDLQQMMGVRVQMVDTTTDFVYPATNALEEPSFSAVRATRLFGVLVRYRLVDIIAILSGKYPSAVPVDRSAGPTKELSVWYFQEFTKFGHVLTVA